ncbi:MAG: 8-hydroxy-5-deazaflavin:NADPH oxidoreductase [Blastocatellia bacterium]|nr:8-hydroxy-5-deazaflavin:NADPH oxidoreductase [Blastocatellia bacterium]
MRIAILGAGSVGGTLGRRFVEAGNEVRFGVPSPAEQKYQDLVQSIGSKASIMTVTHAARDVELVVLATPWDATRAAIVEAGNLAGKIIVDCTNPLKFDSSGLSLSLGYSTSGAEQVAGWAAGAHVVKAFNTTGFGNMGNPHYNDARSVMFVCSDHEQSRNKVIALSNSIGFDTLNAGGLAISRLLEPWAMLWIHLSFTTPLQREFAFGLLRR